MQSSVQQTQVIQQPKPVVQTNATPQAPAQVQQPQQPVAQQYYVTPPPMQQGAQSPNYAGVNIQIFNPSVATPGATAPVYNVNAPSYGQTAPATGCYPPNYYTQPYGLANKGQDTVNNVTNNTTNNTTNKEETKKTEKREIVQLTDEYIKTLENYLNSQDKEVRMMGAKEVIARFQEDDSRKTDPALTALVNKMLQDPYQPVKMLALGILDSRQCTGNDYTVGVLQRMQTEQSGYGQDAKSAANILLKMAGQTVEKEFEVKDKPKKDEDKK